MQKKSCGFRKYWHSELPSSISQGFLRLWGIKKASSGEHSDLSVCPRSPSQLSFRGRSSDEVAKVSRDRLQFIVQEVLFYFHLPSRSSEGGHLKNKTGDNYTWFWEEPFSPSVPHSRSKSPKRRHPKDSFLTFLVCENRLLRWYSLLQSLDIKVLL